MIADTGAGSAQSRFDLIWSEADCISAGGVTAFAVGLAGAYSGVLDVYVVRIPIATLGFDQHVRAVGVPAVPFGFGAIACFRFLNRVTYGNLGNTQAFGQ
jgi:hypothetical protein